MTRLLKLAGGPLAKMFRSLPADKSILDAEINMQLLGDAVEDLVSRLDEGEVVDLIRRLLACTRADNREVTPQFDTLFQGRFATLFKVLSLVIEANYQVPLSGWASAASAAAVEPEPTAAAAR